MKYCTYLIALAACSEQTHFERFLSEQIDSGVQIEDSDVILCRTKDGASQSGVGNGERGLPVQTGVHFLDLVELSAAVEAARGGVPKAQEAIGAVRKQMMAVGGKKDTFNGAAMGEGGGGGSAEYG